MMAVLRFLIDFIYSLVFVFRFFYTKGSCKVIFFKVPSGVLYSYLNFNIVKTVSDRIESISNIDVNLVENQFSDDDHLDEFGINKIKRIIKLGWLISNLKNNKMSNPVQLMKSGEKYFCHPGTDRIIVATYIQPIEYIEGFYLWYPEIDKRPFILDYEYYEITNPFKFLTRFKFSSTFCFRGINLTNELDVSDKCTRPLIRNRSNACFLTAQKCFNSTLDTYNFPYITFYDKVQYTETIDKVFLKDVIKFIDETHCVLSGVPFEKVNGTWITK